MLDKEKVIKYCIEQFLIPFEGEGKRDKDGNFLAYLCPAGIPTIAWGLTSDENYSKVKLGDIWNADKATKVLSKVLNKFLNDLLEASPNLLTETTERVSAILSWVYNLGIGNYRTSTFKKKVDIRDWVLASQECKKWDKAKVNGVSTVLRGLTLRREKEAGIILSAG